MCSDNFLKGWKNKKKQNNLITRSFIPKSKQKWQSKSGKSGGNEVVKL